MDTPIIILNRTGQDRTGQDRTGQDRTRFQILVLLPILERM